MYPTKSAMDYMDEINRIIPRSTENDLFSSPLSPISSIFNQSMAISSSSTDTSPETFSDISRTHESIFGQMYRQFDQSDRSFSQSDRSFGQNDRLLSQNDGLLGLNDGFFGLNDMQLDSMQPYSLFDSQYQLNSQEFQDTPYTSRSRPITGRRLMATDYQVPETQTPPENSIYELFPARKSSELTPVKETNPFKLHMGPRMPDLSPPQPSMSDYWMGLPPSTDSPTPRQSLNFSQLRSEMSYMPSMNFTTWDTPDMPRMAPHIQETSPSKHTPPMSPKYPQFKEPIVPSFRPNSSNKMCSFCRKNGETPLVYLTHAVKEKVGNKNVVTCPILRSHVCSACGVSGDQAHTISYCPVLRGGNNGQPLQSTTITLKSTRIKSNGRRRY